MSETPTIDYLKGLAKHGVRCVRLRQDVWVRAVTEFLLFCDYRCNGDGANPVTELRIFNMRVLPR